MRLSFLRVAEDNEGMTMINAIVKPLHSRIVAHHFHPRLLSNFSLTFLSRFITDGYDQVDQIFNFIFPTFLSRHTGSLLEKLNRD